uniref:ABC2_membrane domain-containing protein n=1 Tax=Gongylonema pulchrum TaxID=637853 RepID=A0A183ECR1_9BILA
LPYRFLHKSDHIFITLSLIVNLSNIFRFPALLSESGGVLFLIPYAVCLGLVTTPIIYLENALGQFSSLPPLQIFHCLCPAFAGIGFALTFISVFKSLLLSYTSLDLFFSLKSLSAALFPSSRKQWLECVHDDHPSCFDPYIICDEANGFYQYYSKCYEISTERIPGNPNFTWAQVVVGMTSTSEALRELPTQIYLFEKIRALDRPSPFLFASAVVQQAIIAFIGILGMRAYAKVRVLFLLILFYGTLLKYSNF